MTKLIQDEEAQILDKDFWISYNVSIFCQSIPFCKRDQRKQIENMLKEKIQTSEIDLNALAGYF